MNSKDLFELHQEILSAELSGTLDEKMEKKKREFLLIINAKIDALATATNMISDQLWKLNDMCERFCSMRDLIANQKTNEVKNERGN